MIPRFAGCAAVPILLLFLAGCGSVQEHRARQHSRAFAELPPAHQQVARAGDIQRGMNPVAVYVSLGTPEHAERLDESTVRWIYFGRLRQREQTAPGNAQSSEILSGFATRADPGIPRRGDQALLLEVFFIDDQLQSWNHRPLESEDLRYQREEDYGRMPVL
jgi:hypothetical protein